MTIEPLSTNLYNSSFSSKKLETSFTSALKFVATNPAYSNSTFITFYLGSIHPEKNCFFKTYLHTLNLSTENDKILNFDTFELTYTEKFGFNVSADVELKVDAFCFKNHDFVTNKFGFETKFMKNCEVEFEKFIEKEFEIDF